MNAQPSRRRSGITLTEILIAIMIMGVGMVSLATLFPLGLLRIREANRMTRSALLAESAISELGTRDLLNKHSFLSPYTNPFTRDSGGIFPLSLQPPVPYDPWVNDTPWPPGSPAFNTGTGAPLGATPIMGTGQPVAYGLPVAYDPFWRASIPNNRYATNPNFNGVGWYLNMDTASEARFGSGIDFIETDSSGTGSAMPSAHGLQRVTNFSPFLTPPYFSPPGIYPNFSGPNTPNSTLVNIFVSPEDIVFQSKTGFDYTQTPPVPLKDSPNLSQVVPDMTFNPNGTTMDFRYTWMFTGHQADDKGTIFEGEIVVFENRPFSIDPALNAPFPRTPGGAYQVSGETVVEAIFGFSPSASPAGTALASGKKSDGFAFGADKNILLRWPTGPKGIPDPEVKIGSWIADVTYERTLTASQSRFGPLFAGQSQVYPGQRCYWYQIVKRSEPTDESAGAGLGKAGYRCMTVWTSSPLNAKTQLTGNGWVINAAMVCPYVVNVFPRTIYSR
jgi:type II secretory pathway pseudopilin PulG